MGLGQRPCNVRNGFRMVLQKLCSARLDRVHGRQTSSNMGEGNSGDVLETS